MKPDPRITRSRCKFQELNVNKKNYKQQKNTSHENIEISDLDFDYLSEMEICDTHMIIVL
jgi:hypothetical protein